MKKPIKNGKEVFAVLSMATVMSISMSVKVNAASDIDAAAKSAYTATINDDIKTSADVNLTRSSSDSKDQELTSQVDKDVVGVKSAENPVEKADNLEATTSGEAKKETALAEENKSENTSLAEDVGAEVEKLEVGGNTPQAQGAGETSTKEEKDPNYSDDEKQIQDYDGSERYKTTDLQPGNVNQELNSTDEKKVKDGFKVDFKNPSETSPSKKEWGYQITIDKKTGQRTYTKIYVTDSGLVPAPLGEKPMMGQGDKLTSESPGVTFTPDEKGEITAAGKQRNFNYEASEETLKHINNKGNSSTSFGMKDNYTKDNPGVKFFGDNFALGYKVNPWPNENDKLQQLKLNGTPTGKLYVQGQTVDTGMKVENLDESARERLVGQVYNPINGKVIEGAKAYIDKDGKVKIDMPAGAVNADGTINENSDFYKDPELRGLTSFDVKFFARPRTAEEFKKIAETPDGFGEKGNYVETGAGTADINHKGKNVTIDKQGIDRYDHYNLIGNFSLQLDDTRYYDQDFIDQDNKPTKDNMTSNIRPGAEFKVKMYTPNNPTEHQKTGAEMNEALNKGQASGKLDTKFLEKKNKEIADKLGVKYEDFIAKDEYKESRWNLVMSKDDIAEFSIVAPKNAKGGDFVALSVEYTYTNGSKDVQKFIFVVKDSTYIRPEYDSSVDFPTEEQTSKAKVIEDEKKTAPNSYSLPDTLEADKENVGNKIVKDDKGNSWKVSIDEKTGQVTAKPLAGGKFEGGEKLQVPVVAHYIDEDEPGKDITEETVAEFYIKERANMTARYNAKAGKAGDKLSSDVIHNEEDKYNRRPTKFTLASNTYTDDKGNTWNVSIDEKTGKVTATVPNAEEGKSIDGALLNVPVTAHYYDTDGTEKGTRQAEVQFVGSGTKGTHKYKEEIPFEVEVRKDPSLKKGEWKYATDDKGNELKGEKGEQEKTLTIVNSKVTETSDPTVTKQAKKAVILVGDGTNDGTHEIKEKKVLPFETKIEYDENLEAGQREETGGEPGEQERTNTLVIKDGKVTETKEGEFKTTKDPVDKVIKIGIKPIVKEVEKPFETEYIYDENVEMGKEEEVTPGEKGKVTITTSYDKDQNKLVTKEETKDPVKRVVKVGTKPVTKVVEKPFNTEYQYDENLEAGKTEEVTPGKNGKVTITTSYDETQKKIVTSETEESGQNRVVKIGGKTKGTIEILDKLAYEVEVIKDDTLDAGTFKTVQEGIDGEKKTTLTIENSKEIKGSRKEGITKQPVKKIIKVGTKPTENMCPVPEGPRTPDDNGPNKPGTPGVTPNRPNEPGTPGDNTQSKPGKNTTNKPVENTPSEPGKKTPNKPGENPSVDPKNTPQEAPEKPKLEKENELRLSETEKVKEAEKAKEADEEIETEEAKVLNQVKKEEDEEASRVGNEAGKANLAGDDKAPKTGDAGLMAETASAGLASGLLLLLGRFKRKKEDEE